MRNLQHLAAHQPVGARCRNRFSERVAPLSANWVCRAAVGLLALVTVSLLSPTAQAQTTVWSETLTVGSQTTDEVTSYGWDDGGNYSGASLSSNVQDFDYGYETFDLDSIDLTNGTLTLVFDEGAAGDISDKSTRDKLPLQVGGQVFKLGRAYRGTTTETTTETVSSVEETQAIINGELVTVIVEGEPRTIVTETSRTLNHVLKWNTTGLTWSANDTVSLKIVENDTAPPVVVGQRVSRFGSSVKLQFNEDLDDYSSGPSLRRAFAVTVDGVSRETIGTHVWGNQGLVQIARNCPGLISAIAHA